LAPARFAARLEQGRTKVLAHGRDVREFDLFLTPRVIGEQGSEDFQIEVYRAMTDLGCVLVNQVDALLRAVDKFRSSALFERAGLPTPKVVVVQDPDEAGRVLAAWRRAIVKPPYGSLGKGVRLLHDGELSRAGLARLCRRYRALYLQRYVAKARDIRAFVVGDDVVAAIYRYAAPGQVLCNVHSGARTQSVDLPREYRRLAVAAAKAVGLAYTGVDLIEGADGPVVIEVNGTPRWEGIFKATGLDMADAIVDYGLALAERSGSGREIPRPAAPRSGRREVGAAAV
jgi:ribosomal protein S6--L-glutamate ligase